MRLTMTATNVLMMKMKNWDQGTGIISYADIDGDGFGDPSSELICTLTEGYVETVMIAMTHSRMDRTFPWQSRDL